MNGGKFLGLIRIVLLVVSTAVLGLTLVWVSFPDRVDRIDKWWVAHYEGRYQDRFANAKGLTGEPFLTELESLRRDLGAFRKGDRLAELRYKVLKHLVAGYLKSGQPASAVACLDELVALDPRDISGRIERARIMRDNLGRRDFWRDEVTLLYESLATAPVVRNEYVELLIGQGSHSEALDLFRKSLIING